MSLGWEEKFISPFDPNDLGDFDSSLASAGLNDVIRMFSESRKNQEDLIGPLTARLVELGDQTSHGNTDHQQLYSDSMRLQKQRLEQNPSWRRHFALHPRTYGRPPTHLITDADDWVVPMIEAEVEEMSADDLALLRHHMIMRVGRQHEIHADFRPLLLKIAIDDETLSCLASTEQGLPFKRQTNKSYLIAAVAHPFIDVVMLDPDDGIELEAAAWDYAQRQIAEACQSTSGNRFIESLRKMSSLLTTINSSRALAAECSQAQMHAGLATRSAIAEFILLNFVLLMTNPEEALENSDFMIGCFIRRDDIGRSPIDLPKEALDLWAAKRTSKRLMQDLAMITLLSHDKWHDLPPIPAVSGHDLSNQADQYFAKIEQSSLGKRVAQAIHQGWHFDCWACAA